MCMNCFYDIIMQDTKMLMTVVNRSIENIPIREVCIACAEEEDNLIVSRVAKDMSKLLLYLPFH